MFSLTVNPRLATNPALSSLWEKTCKGSVSALLFVTCNNRATSVAVLLEVFFAFFTSWKRLPVSLSIDWQKFFCYKKQTIKVWFFNETHLIADFIFLKLLFTTAGQLVSGFEDTYKKQITQSYNRVVEIG